MTDIGKSEITGNNGHIVEPLNATITEHNDFYKLTIDVPECVNRKNVSIACVIDVSGSMGTSVGIAEGSEARAFTRLDLVKHVLNVIISSLEENDQLSLVTFTTDATLTLDLSNMTEFNKNAARKIAKKMTAECDTFTFKGLEMAYKVLEKAPEENVKSIILLTDGDDTEGETKLISRFDGLKIDKRIQLNTFGFSNDIKSTTLEKLALRGGGIFGFIPDQTMIGTVFVNCMACLFMTHSQNVSINIDENFEIVAPKIQTNQLTLHYGQTKNFLLKRKTEGTSSFSMTSLISHFIKPHDNNKEFKLKIGDEETLSLQIEKPNDDDKLKSFKKQLARMKLLEFLKDKSLPCVQLKNYVNSNEIKSVPEFLLEFQQMDEYDRNNEQLSFAINDYKTWGQHYIISMFFAHQNEQCLNYKSPSMKIYKNKQFNELVDKLTDIFITLPLPEPTGDVGGVNMPYINTNDMMDYGGGCILGTCNIKMHNGDYKQIRSLKKDDAVFGGAKIVCLIKMKHTETLAKIGNLILTPFHPVFIDDKWQFPHDIVANNSDANSRLILDPPEDTYVYNIVLDKHHIVDVEGIGCITLGHMYDDGILKHDYYGTNKVIDDLSKLSGWNEGFISLKSYKCHRDTNGNVCGMSDFVYC